MNRRSFLSTMLGAAGAPLVPWRGLIEPRIFLLGREEETVASITLDLSRTHLTLEEIDRVQTAIAEEFRLPKPMLFGCHPMPLSPADEAALSRYHSWLRESWR